MGEQGRDADLEVLKGGDEAAFQALIQRYHGPMLRLAMAYVRDLGVAEDVVQESWLTCLRRLDDFEGRSSLKTWIFGIVMNIARARRRKEIRILPFASLWNRDDSDSTRPTVDPSRFGSDGMWRDGPGTWENVPEARLLGQETLNKVKAAIDQLPPKQKEVIVLRDVAGFEADEVSSLLGLTATNQRVRLHRARAAVRKSLEEYMR